MHSFANAHQYYILERKDSLLQSIKIIRHLDEKIAIIELKSQAEIELLKQHLKIAEAVDKWKFSPSPVSINVMNEVNTGCYIRCN